MNYTRLNKYLGWLAAIIGSFVYLSTAEWTASLWDCGEFIATAYKLEVGHPPGAPFFMLVGRVFSLFAGSVTEVAHWVNRMSALSSGLSIGFLFWSITLLGKKIAQKDGAVMTTAQMIAVFGAGMVGAMAYTFTDSFWFSAVEGEVYAMSSLFTAVIFWALLKWDEEMTMRKRGELHAEINPLRWMVLIMFLIGLAIGVHLLGLLVVPSIAYVVAHQIREKSSPKIFIVTGLIGVAVLAFIQNGIIPGSVSLVSKMEIFFVDNLHLPFGTGVAFFFILLVSLLVGGLIITRKRNSVVGNTVVLGLIMLFIGYGSFTTLVIRSNANPPLDENNPENLATLKSYLNREQYGQWPLLYGQHFNSKRVSQREYKDHAPVFDRRWVVETKSGSTITSFKDKRDAEKYVADSGKDYVLDERYFQTNKGLTKNQKVVYSQNTLFPRMFDGDNSEKVKGYKNWSGYNPNRKVNANERGEDGRPLPTFGDNMQYMIDYQIGWMYWRYFMWNFSGRQNDIQGHGDQFRGNWISGFSAVDNVRLGAQDENAPYYTKNNPNHTKFYFIPLILGLIGMFFHFLRSPKDAIVVGILFLLTGLAIVIYLNQTPLEPRERDYSFAGSFYVFSIWIGLGVYGLFEAFRSFTKEDFIKLGYSIGGLIGLGLIADIWGSSGMPATISAVIISIIGGGALALMGGLRKVNFSMNGAAGIAIVLGLVGPYLLGTQGWQGHDRSNRYSTRALAHNYLVGCGPNSIIFTNGDNDTFPLWYIQEVEGFRTDIRVANLSLMQTDWYSNQMKMRAYESDPLPIQFREDQILRGLGNTDYVLFVDYEIYKQSISPQKAREILKKKIESNEKEFDQSITQFRVGLASVLDQFNGKSSTTESMLAKMQEVLSEPVNNPGIKEYEQVNKFVDRIFSDVRKGKISADDNLLEQLQVAATSWMEAWDYLPLDYVMDFVRDDENMLEQRGGRKIRFFPSSGFILNVNADNAVQAGIISEEYKSDLDKEVKFDFRRGGLFSSDIQGLSREEVMMLDVLANFDWKRGIYFSSPVGSDVSKAFYASGYIHNLGQAYGFVPIKGNRANDFSNDLMYENIVKRYDYGNLAADGVLVDYYTRRQTDQYRGNFLDLATRYLRKYNESKGEKADFYANRVDSIISYSLEVLPIDKVLDFGEPRAVSAKLPNGQTLYTDGSIPDYVRALYEIGSTEKADQLAIDYLEQMETMINYFEHSDSWIAYKSKKDFISFAMNFLRTYGQVIVNSPNSNAAMYAQELDRRLTEDVVEKVIDDLSTKTISDVDRRGKTVNRSGEKEAQEFAELYHALLKENGFQIE